MRQMSTLQRLLIILLLTVSTPISIAADVKPEGPTDEKVPEETGTVPEQEITEEAANANAQEPVTEQETTEATAKANELEPGPDVTDAIGDVQNAVEDEKKTESIIASNPEEQNQMESEQPEAAKTDIKSEDNIATHDNTKIMENEKTQNIETDGTNEASKNEAPVQITERGTGGVIAADQEVSGGYAEDVTKATGASYYSKHNGTSVNIKHNIKTDESPRTVHVKIDHKSVEAPQIHIHIRHHQGISEILGNHPAPPDMVWIDLSNPESVKLQDDATKITKIAATNPSVDIVKCEDILVERDYHKQQSNKLMNKIVNMEMDITTIETLIKRHKEAREVVKGIATEKVIELTNEQTQEAAKVTNVVSTEAQNVEATNDQSQAANSENVQETTTETTTKTVEGETATEIQGVQVPDVVVPAQTENVEKPQEAVQETKGQESTQSGGQEVKSQNGQNENVLEQKQEDESLESNDKLLYLGILFFILFCCIIICVALFPGSDNYSEDEDGEQQQQEDDGPNINRNASPFMFELGDDEQTKEMSFGNKDRRGNVENKLEDYRDMDTNSRAMPQMTVSPQSGHLAPTVEREVSKINH